MASFRWFGRRAKMAGARAVAQQVAPAAPVQRRYLEEMAYPLPKDQGEHDRLEFQHHALNLTLGNHYLAPLPPTVRLILDVGTGTVRRIGGR